MSSVLTLTDLTVQDQAPTSVIHDRALQISYLVEDPRHVPFSVPEKKDRYVTVRSPDIYLGFVSSSAGSLGTSREKEVIRDI